MGMSQPQLSFSALVCQLWEEWVLRRKEVISGAEGNIRWYFNYVFMNVLLPQKGLGLQG